MKLVAAAKVRRAQDAVVNGRPFAENLVKVLWAVNQKLRVEDVDSPLVEVRPVKTVMVVCVTGDRGLCGGYNNFAIKKCENRVKELLGMGLAVKIVTVGKKGGVYFKRRPQYTLAATFDLGAKPTIKEAQAIADELYSGFVSADVDKVEMVYTKFVSLISSEPTVQTLLPLTPAGEICSVDGTCVDAAEDELFKLTTVGGKLAVEVEKVRGGRRDEGGGRAPPPFLVFFFPSPRPHAHPTTPPPPLCRSRPTRRAASSTRASSSSKTPCRSSTPCSPST
jgi:F-type H+-transporting ATPase subunit gamma